jgi:hypothetical protein
MMCAFGDELQASRVRELYIEEIKKCDQEEIIYSVKHRDGLLTTKDITLRQETKVRRHQLCLEWYDIHSNKDLSYEETPFIAKNRFQETSDREYFSFEKMSELELKSIQQSIVEMTAQLKETFSRPNPVNASIKNPHNIGLFKTPQCFVQKKHMVKIAELGTSLMN